MGTKGFLCTRGMIIRSH